MYFCYAMKHPSLTFCLCDVFTKKMVEYITCTLYFEGESWEL